MLTIDIHTHILPSRIPDYKSQFGYGGFIQLNHHRSGCASMVRDDGTLFREVQANCWDASIRMGECDESTVDVQVLSTVPTMFNYWAAPKDALTVARYLNDHIAEVVSTYPKRFIGLGTLPMQSPDLAVDELDRCMHELGLRGVQIGSHVNDWNLDEPCLFPVFDACQAMGAAVFVHPWDMMGAELMPKYWLPWLVGMPAETSRAICSMIFGGVLERLPRLRVAFAHGGGSFPGTLGRINRGFEVRPDLCAVDNAVAPREYLGRFFVDSLVHDKVYLDFLLQVFGENQIAMGSDYPFPLGEACPGSLIKGMTHLSQSTRERLLAGTAFEWLNLRKGEW